MCPLVTESLILNSSVAKIFDKHLIFFQYNIAIFLLFLETHYKVTLQSEEEHVPRGARGVQPDARVRPAHQPRQRGRGGLLQRLGGEHRAHQGPAQLPAARVQVHRRRGREVLYNTDCRHHQHKPIYERMISLEQDVLSNLLDIVYSHVFSC